MSITRVNKDNLSIKELEPLTEDIIQSDNEEDQTEQQNVECIKINNFITEGINKTIFNKYIAYVYSHFQLLDFYKSLDYS